MVVILSHPSINRNRKIGEKLKKPSYIKAKAPQSEQYNEMVNLVRKKALHTVCQEAACPNIGECWEKRHATFLIMGDICTRSCRFCNIKTGKPKPLDECEPEKVADSIRTLSLRHSVITSVDRDDLPDGGAKHFSLTIQAIRKKNPQITIEILTPDFRHVWQDALDIIFRNPPDVFNHNVETVPRLYPYVRSGARYYHSMRLLEEAKKKGDVFTKSGLMVGLGEDKREVFQVMDDLRSAGVDFITIGQYLRPTERHWSVHEYVSLELFKEYKIVALSKGFLLVSSSPLTRSSYHADEDFLRLQQAKRNNEL